MTGSRLSSLFAAASFAALAAAGANAQDVPTAPLTVPEAVPEIAANNPPVVAQPAVDPNLVVNELYGEWGVRCYNIQSPAPCDMVQFASNPTTEARVMMISIAYIPSEEGYIAQIVVPLGVALARGLNIEAGAASLNGITFSRCGTDGCYVDIAVPTPTIDALITTTDMTQLSMYSYGGNEPYQIPFTVNGFGDALARMRAEATTRAVPLEQ